MLRSFKKLVSLVLVLALSLAVSLPAFAAKPTDSQTKDSGSYIIKDSGIEQPIIDSKAQSSYYERYMAITPLGTSDTNIFNNVQGVVNRMGYSAQSFSLRPAIDIYNNLPYNHFTIIHGHGGPGSIECDHTSAGQSEAWSGLYAYPVTLSNSKDACMANYISNALGRHKLIVFITCNGAQPKNGYSMASQSVNKGAACSIGFYNKLIYGGEWLQDFVGQLHNRYTVQNSINKAKNIFNNKYPSILESSMCPTYSGNLHTFGKTSTIVRVN